MTNEPIHDSTTSNVFALSTHGAHMQHAPEEEAAAEADEPPDDQRPRRAATPFKRSAVRKVQDHSESLLTKALHHSEEEPIHLNFDFSSKRRPLNSSASLASTADLTSDTGFTSPARTVTPSPPPPVISLNSDIFFNSKQKIALPHLHTTAPVATSRDPIVNKEGLKDPAVEALTRKRCISFACGPKADAKKPASPPQIIEPKPAADERPQRKSCIKWAGPTNPASRMSKLDGQQSVISPALGAPKARSDSPAAVRKLRSPSTGRGRALRSSTPRPSSRSPIPVRPSKYLTANTNDLNCESSRFHEFASDEPQEEDWIRLNLPPAGRRLTINDTLQKENEIRRLGKEAEEEELEEEEEYEGGEEEEEEEDLGEDDEEDEVGHAKYLPEEKDDEDEYNYDFDDDQSGYRSGDDASDGYNTDNENGFADSDDDDDGGNLELWTPSRVPAARFPGETHMYRRPSLSGNRSDSSCSDVPNNRSTRPRRIHMRPGTPELPDSTDFVCGTLDEDRALEDAYISCIAARRREKLHPIPQDIDPSFPTSEPEDEDVEPRNPVHESDGHRSETDHGSERCRRIDLTSPKRYHSPPPKRHHASPKARGRSPKRLFDRHSPRRLMSPPPGPMMPSPPSSLFHDVSRREHDFQSLAFRPGLTHTKSLPRAPAVFPQHLKAHRRPGKSTTTNGHVRGAIDIVKGLEQKRQRRREKFKEKYLQKHCNKARKGQIPEKKPQPGQGAERMREIGLLMAGKLGPDQFVLSI
ncbi:hypothetical protein GGS23DRAFT_456298 [Durotheca rogersii]|uniref:uncharacterized protein n=1 Tax=Durotheca rogersii TaxID=419775 RepID=UPI00221F701E|nr:uncharacterized protein GGS23DRAFT_456298 [Durotheca rogersii]KAI5864616.1 hypothetical protein GGS23DRAFT_456298 [Durotheca rogersii]